MVFAAARFWYRRTTSFSYRSQAETCLRLVHPIYNYAG